ncbi:putative prolyl 4-hydroxylase 4 [Podospora australis]|uniref:Prolyl 4-hydroxylase 4 n=1 Tax=Podospora australis TaxID=1536484 RepID=A0AAN6X487_9PEZI|nr:putative prolyl 4-hydroxylase 4 [Podospora australis]
MAKDKRPKSKPATLPLAATTPPSWPVFKPALPVVDLELETLVSEKVVVLRSFFPQKLCRDYVAFLRTLPLLTTPGKPKRGDAVRVNDRFQIQDHRFADRLWSETGLKDALLQYPDATELWGGEIIGLNPNIRVYRYSPGQFFDAHYDDANSVTVTTSSGEQIPAKTTWTLLLYLTSAAEGCMGGETIFYPHDRQSPKEAIPVSLETGMLLLHKHGDDCMLHEGSEVTAGEKWVLRTDLCVRK